MRRECDDTRVMIRRSSAGFVPRVATAGQTTEETKQMEEINRTRERALTAATTTVD